MMDVDTMTNHQPDHKPAKLLPPPPVIPPMPPDDPPLPLKRKCAELANTFDWVTQLSDPNFLAASVSCFRHVSYSETSVKELKYAS